MITKRIQNITLSGTMEISAKSIEMKNNGIDVINLAVGEPDLPTPEHIKQAAIKAINNNYTKYTASSGLKELKTAIQNKFLEDYNVHYDLNQIIVSTGAKQALYNTMQTIISPGDEVIVPAPYWVSYVDMVSLAEGIPKIVNTKFENKFKLTPEEFKENITGKTKAIILCNPSNPTGSLFTKEELTSIVEVAMENNITIIADEIYEKLVYGSAKFTSVTTFGDEVKNNSIIINGVSKAYSMTGWRIGYACAKEEIISGMGKLQSHSTSNASSISQHAAIAAISGSQQSVAEQKEIFEKRRDFVVEKLNQIDSVDFTIPDGAFYFFIDISKALQNSSRLKTSREFCLELLEKGHLATVPGSAFGMENHIRLSFPLSIESLNVAMGRFNDFIKSI